MAVPRSMLWLAGFLLVPPPSVSADTVTLVSSRDSTIYQGNPSNSNGGGQSMFAGTTGLGASCRALIAFDVAGNLPAGSTITRVQFGLVLAQVSSSEFTARQIQLYRLGADWGEGSAGAGGGTGGQGFPTAADGSTATWTHRFYATQPWTNPGGDFAPLASASALVGILPNEMALWESTPALVQDVQAWLDEPASNFGWSIVGDESVPATARLFFSREAADSTVRPALVITFTPPAPNAPRLLLSTATSVVAGMPFNVTITAVDDSGQVVTGYTGTVSFGSSDPYPGLLPTDYTFTTADNGTHSFSGMTTFFTAGVQTLSVQDTANPALSSSAPVMVMAAPAGQLSLLAPGEAGAGTPFDVLVLAVDPYGNVDGTYAGTITWASSDPDPGVVLPADYAFQAGESGSHRFADGVVLMTVGAQILVATDTLSGITGVVTVTVDPAP